MKYKKESMIARIGEVFNKKLNEIDTMEARENERYKISLKRIKIAHDKERGDLELLFLKKKSFLDYHNREAFDKTNDMGDNRIKKLTGLRRIKLLFKGFFGRNELKDNNGLKERLDLIEDGLDDKLNLLKSMRDERIGVLIRQRDTLLREKEDILHNYKRYIHGRMNLLEKKINDLEKKDISLVCDEIRKRKRFGMEFRRILDKHKKNIKDDRLDLSAIKFKRIIDEPLNEDELKRQLEIAKKDLEIFRGRIRVYSKRTDKQIKNTERFLDNLEQKKLGSLKKSGPTAI